MEPWHEILNIKPGLTNQKPPFKSINIENKLYDNTTQHGEFLGPKSDFWHVQKRLTGRALDGTDSTVQFSRHKADFRFLIPLRRVFSFLNFRSLFSVYFSFSSWLSCQQRSTDCLTTQQLLYHCAFLFSEYELLTLYVDESSPLFIVSKNTKTQKHLLIHERHGDQSDDN